MGTQIETVGVAMDGGEIRPADIAGCSFQEPDAVAPSLQDRIVLRHAVQRATQFRRPLRHCFHAGQVGGDNAGSDNATLQQHLSAGSCHDTSLLRWRPPDSRAGTPYKATFKCITNLYHSQIENEGAAK